MVSRRTVSRGEIRKARSRLDRKETCEEASSDHSGTHRRADSNGRLGTCAHSEFVSTFATASGRLGRRIVGLGVRAGSHVVLLAIFLDGRRSIVWGMGRWVVAGASYSDLHTEICGECATTQVTV